MARQRQRPRCERVCPGLVVLRGAVGMVEQLELACYAMERGNEPAPRGFWVDTCSSSGGGGGGGRRRLNSTATRGRIFDALSAHAHHERLAAICAGCLDQATRADPSIPKTTPTHLLLLLYTGTRGVSPHQDNGPNDGVGRSPVVSMSVGNACDFAVHPIVRAETRPKKLIRLESGDVVIFGGPSRFMWHAVPRVYPGTAPDHLRAFIGDARLNLTFRHAPDILGAEDQFRYFRAGRFTADLELGAAPGESTSRPEGREPPEDVGQGCHQSQGDRACPTMPGFGALADKQHPGEGDASSCGASSIAGEARPGLGSGGPNEPAANTRAAEVCEEDLDEGRPRKRECRRPLGPDDH